METSVEPKSDTRERRDRVRLMLDELGDRGLRPRRGQTGAALAEDLAQLVKALDHLTPENLLTLRDLILDAAGGAKRDEWPSFVVIRNLALAMQPRPVEEHRIVRSWLASVEGPKAEAGGYLVPLYRFLRRVGRPPLPLDMRQIREQAQDGARRRAMIEERARADMAWAEDGPWLAEWRRDEEAARAIIAQARERAA